MNTLVQTVNWQSLLTDMANKLIATADEAGMNITIERISRKPLAMGNHKPVVTIYPKRGN